MIKDNFKILRKFLIVPDFKKLRLNQG
jgi:hypothetical protein